ncbi:uncharacterized protein Fot_29789 [Forsythia ovata]|uniref:Uncharacterized protein n=1 Tax=Forsythia ovata TaxID=205694 RepID=A0ABD1TSW6_9LAMI
MGGNIVVNSCCICVSYMDYTDIISSANFLYSLGMLLEFASFLWLRRKFPTMKRPYRVPKRLPALVYPLFLAVGTAIGICGFQLIRNICINPEVRVSKEGRAAGVLENYAEGQKYAEHGLRKLVRNRRPEIMPSINSFFSDPQKN